MPSELEPHEIWYKTLRTKYENLNDAEKIKKMLQNEVGNVFSQVLTDSGVFKRDAQGLAAFDKFAKSVF